MSNGQHCVTHVDAPHMNVADGLMGALIIQLQKNLQPVTTQHVSPL